VAAGAFHVAHMYQRGHSVSAIVKVEGIVPYFMGETLMLMFSALGLALAFRIA
jgi:hypothetical protein